MLVLLIGTVGSGKSVFMVMMAHQSYTRNVYANFRIKHPKFKFLSDVDILNIPPNTDVYLDEAYNKIEKRRAMDSKNLIYSHIFNQRRKTDSIWYLSEQIKNLIDFRFEKYANLIIYCHKRYSKYDDFTYEYEFEDCNETVIEHYTYNEMSIFFDLYDTNEIVKDDMSKKTEYLLVKDIPDLLPKYQKEIYNKIKNDITTGTKIDIEMCLIKNKIYHMWKKYIYPYHKQFDK
jgi:GTPase SAR1 family protein